MATAGDVMDRSAALMNDVNKATYNYTIQLPYLKMAWERLRAILQSISSPIFKEVSGSTQYIAYSSSVNKPPDLFIPLELSERRLGGTDDEWVQMLQKDWEPISEPSESALHCWTWREQQLQVRPCTIDREVLIKYVKNLDELTSQATSISVDNAVNYLAFKNAEFCVRYIARNPEKAMDLMNDAEVEREYMEIHIVKQRQFERVRRRPYRHQTRRYWSGR